MVTQNKILVAMSGGVDSSVTAALLKKAGYDVTGVFMINWEEDSKGGPCTQEADQTDARKVAHKLGIKLYTWNFAKEYKQYVFDHYIQAIKDGLTPNPDTVCNKYIKFGAFLDRARGLGFEMVATGHYAQIKKTLKHKNIKIRKQNGKIQNAINKKQSFVETIHRENIEQEKQTDIQEIVDTSNEVGGTSQRQKDSKYEYKLFSGRDETKDQSYFLYELNQKQLSQVIFPIGKYKKKKIREMAKKFDLPVWDKKDSYGICYIGERNMPEFLSQFIEPNPGDIVDKDGKILGTHDGLHNYTIGQRQGIKIGGTGPYFVVKKDYDNNNLVVTNNAEDPGLLSKEMRVGEMNWIVNYDNTRQQLTQSGGQAKSQKSRNLKATFTNVATFGCLVRTRHLKKLVKCRVEILDDHSIKVTFDQPQKAITPGQVAVFYQQRGLFGKEYKVLGGGVIQS